jgi:MFS family permease
MSPASSDLRQTHPESPDGNHFSSEAYAWYVVGVLTLAYMFSFLDRQIISFMIEPIRRDFGLSNGQVGLLHGTTFAIFYAFFGLPVGRWADTHSRRGLIAAGFVVWSLMTAASGLAQKFWQLLLCRTGVAVGEATLSPAAYSLISDYFPPQRRATAIGVYTFGIYLGSGVSLVCLGLLTGFLSRTELPVLPIIGAVRPWQAVFFIVGLPGVLFALLLCTVREAPRRHGLVNAAQNSTSAPTRLRDVFVFLAAHRAIFLSLFLGMASLTFAGYANSAWMIKLFIQRHGWSPERTGLVVGFVTALGGGLGAVGGGRLADALRSRGFIDANMRVAILGAALMATSAIFYPLATSGEWAATGLMLLMIGFSAPFGVVAADIQHLAPSRMRAQTSALFLFVINLLGMGLGPPITGWLIDGLSSGDESKVVHLALMIAILAGSVIALLIFALGLRSYRRAMQDPAINLGGRD